MPYQIQDWNKHFENAKSRQIDRCSSVHLPNKAGGLGMSRVLAEEDGAAIFGIFVLLVEACSRHPRPRDGWLTRDGHPEATPWSLGDLEVILHRPAQEIKRTLDALSSPAIGWIKVTGKCLSSSPEVTPECPSGDREVDTNELTNERRKERKNERPADSASQEPAPEGYALLSDLIENDPPGYRLHNIDRLKIEFTDWDQYSTEDQEMMIQKRMGEHYVPPADLPF